MKDFLTSSDREALLKLQRNVSSRSEYIKVTSILMLNSGDSVSFIAERLGIDESTIYNYKKSIIDVGIDTYLTTHYQGKWGWLSCCQISELRTELNRGLYTDSKEVIKYITARFGYTYSVSGVVDLLHRIGYSYKQTTQIPCEADAEQQQVFLDEVLPQLLAEAEQGEAVLYYSDGVHPTHNTRSTHAWIETGTTREQPSVSGRDRVNINGAINALDVTDVEIVESASVNAQSTKKFYEQILEKHPTAKTIYVIQDNARYYRNAELKAWLESQPRLKQVFLPPYSPNLNLIERLWKFMRKKVINTSFFRTKKEFKEAIIHFFANIETYKSELVTLLTLNFAVINSNFKT